MEDSISRQAAIDILDAFQVKVENGEGSAYSWARMRMTELPFIQERKKGRWINEGIYGEGHSQCSIRCSNCDWHYIGYPGDYKYCPECGSKNMEGAEDAGRDE